MEHVKSQKTPERVKSTLALLKGYIRVEGLLRTKKDKPNGDATTLSENTPASKLAGVDALTTP